MLGVAMVPGRGLEVRGRFRSHQIAPRGIAFGIAGAAVVLGAIEVGGTIALGDGFTGGDDPVVGFVFGLLMLPLLGIVIFGLPALVPIVPIALVWSALVRAIARRDDVPV